MKIPMFLNTSSTVRILSSWTLLCHLLLVLVLLSVSLLPISAMPIACNGLSNLCNVKVVDSYFAMVHNAMAAVDNGFAFAANHIDDPIVESLTAGYRGLSIDICNCNGNLVFCHGNDIIGCGIGSVDPIQAFTEINEWIVANPNNVIMISLQINEDAGGAISLDMIQELLQQVPNGFSNRLYDHWPITNEWPTLGQLIETNQQVLFFYFQGPNGTGDHIAGLNYWYDFVLATNWQWESISELESTLFDTCPITRGIDTATGDFFLIEAYVTEKALFGLQFQPSRESAQQINTVDWAGNILDACFDIHGFPANIIMVDFWSEGNLPTLIQQRNALLLVGSPTTPTTTVESTTSPTMTPTKSSTTVSNTIVMSTMSPTTQVPTTVVPTSPDPTVNPTLNDNMACTLETNDGKLVTIPDGESYGNYLTTRCGSSNDFPCYCRMGKTYCPYCGFVAQDLTLYCAKYNETISFIDGTIYKTCTCGIPATLWEEPISSCQEEEVSSSSSSIVRNKNDMMDPTTTAIDPDIDTRSSEVDTTLQSLYSLGVSRFSIGFICLLSVLVMTITLLS